MQQQQCDLADVAPAHPGVPPLPPEIVVCNAQGSVVEEGQQAAATPGFSLTSAPGRGRRGGHQLYGLSEAASRPPPGAYQALSADGRAAASTDAQIGSVAPGREVRLSCDHRLTV